MKLQLLIDAVIVAETTVDTSPGSAFEALELIERLRTQWHFRLDPTEWALEPHAQWNEPHARPYYYESTLINVRFLP